jgi:geranylgeranyl reductase family protein
MHDFEVAIVGAGPAGSVSAMLLAKAGIKVVLIDRARFPRDKVCGDGITPRGARLLSELGILKNIEARAFACRGMTLRGSDHNSFNIDLEPDSRGPHELLVVPRLLLDQMLLDEALQTGVTYLDLSKVERVEQEGDGCEVVLADGKRISSSLALLATGAESQVLRASGLLADKPRLEHAARGYFEGVEGLEPRVTLFFDGIDLPGYGWVFPTSPTSANIGCGVFSRSGMPQMQRLKTLLHSHPMLKRQLAHANLSAPLRAYPLRTDFTPDCAGRDLRLCVGEAAGLVNPITGEGIDYAFESARFASDSIIAALRAHQPERALPLYRERLARRFERRFRIYRWVQRNCLSEHQADDFLGAVKASPALQRTVVNGLFGRARPIDYFRPDVLLPAVRLALKARRMSRNAARQNMRQTSD